MSNEMKLPIIRLEVQGIKYTVVRALTEHAAQMDADIQAAVEEYCTPQNLQSIVRTAAHDALRAAIEEEVKAFFTYGDGRKAVAAAVKESILQNKTYTAMDERKP